MVHSMTAFAASNGASGDVSWTIEMRGVNAKGLDIRFRLPEALSAQEATFRAAVQRKLHRGNVQIAVRIESVSSMSGLRVNEGALDFYLNAAIQVRSRAKNLGLRLPTSEATDFLSLRGVVESTDDVGSLLNYNEIVINFNKTLDEFVRMRRSEGEALTQICTDHLDRIAELTKSAQESAEERKPQVAEKLRENLASVMEGAANADPERVAQELALMAVKSDVTEEIDRLLAHVDAARLLLQSSEPIGRKLDFLMQEFNREANTLCSKAGSTDLTRIGLDLKAAIDQMREQVQNVE